MKTITITELKKYLKDYEQKDLIQLICELRKNNPQVATYLTLKFSQENQTILVEEYIQKIEKCFYSSKLRLKEADDLVKEFCKLSQNEEQNALIRLRYVECMSEVIVNYGLFDERSINKTASVFEDFIFKTQPETLDRLRKRVDQLMELVSEFDILYEIFQEIYYGYYE